MADGRLRARTLARCQRGRTVVVLVERAVTRAAVRVIPAVLAVAAIVVLAFDVGDLRTLAAQALANWFAGLVLQS